jgi:hypothetical protein
MEPDLVSHPEEFAAANEKARRERLRSLTLEKAAEELEDLLNFQVVLEEANEAMELPPPLPNPHPGPTLAILLAGSPSSEP